MSRDMESGHDAAAAEFERDGAFSPFERAYRGILRALYEEAIVPGQRLAAPDLMQRFDVGRGTIREVLNRLASTGVVSLVPHRGAQVRLFSRAEVNDLLDIVELLLGLAARGAARAVHEGRGREELSNCHAHLQQPNSLDEFSRFFQAREDYYRCIVRLSGNPELQRLFPAAQVHILRVQLRRYQNAADSMALSDYAALTNAILSGDRERAEQSGREHVGFTRTRVSQVPDSAFSAPRR